MMSEKEKMDQGMWYDANYNPDLIAQRRKARDLCFKLNQTLPSDTKTREALLAELFGYFPENLDLTGPFICDYGRNITIGKNVFINTNCYFMDGAPISLGDNVFMGPFCGLYTANHPLEVKERNEGREQALPITIGRDCWIGANVTILPGVEIGHSTVIAAGSLVTRSIPPHCLAVGSPCEVIKRID